MNSLTFVSHAAGRRERPIALIIAPEFRRIDYQGSVLREFDAEMTTAEMALAEPATLPACVLLLADTRDLTETSAASLLALATAHRQNGTGVIVVCPEAHIDFQGALIGTGATLLCEPRPEDIDRALHEAIHAIQRRDQLKNRSAHIVEAGAIPALACPWPKAEITPEPIRPYWLDILSDQLTDLAIAQQAAAHESPAIAELVEQMIRQLLALIPDRALLAAVASDSSGEGAAEFERLIIELKRRELTVSRSACSSN